MLQAAARQSEVLARGGRLERHHPALRARQGLSGRAFLPRIHAADAARSSRRVSRRASVDTASAAAPPLAVCLPRSRSAGRRPPTRSCGRSHRGWRVFPINHDIAPVKMAGGPRAGAAAVDGVRVAAGWSATQRITIIRTVTRRAGCRRISTSATSRRTRSSPRSSPTRAGRRRRLGGRAGGKREGWWGVPPSAGGVSSISCSSGASSRSTPASTCRDYERWESLPDWAKRTLEQHARGSAPASLHAVAAGIRRDRTTRCGTRRSASCVAEGWFHGYLRMLWGKKIYEWSPSRERRARARWKP